MLDFKPITLEDREQFNTYTLGTGTLACAKSFAYVYAWAQGGVATEISFQPEAVYVRVPSKGCYSYISPIVIGSHTQVLERMLSERLDCGCRFRLISADEQMAQAAAKLGLRVTETPDAHEYLYATADLTELKGKKYHAKRNFVNRFVQGNAFTYQPLTKEDAGECMVLLEQWAQDRENRWVAVEQGAIRACFEAWDALDLRGGIIRMDGRVAAFTIGEVIGDMGIVHFEKADASVVGLYPTINKLFAAEALGDTRIINRQEDMGLEGLRKAKQSYHPVAMVNKYDITCPKETNHED